MGHLGRQSDIPRATRTSVSRHGSESRYRPSKAVGSEEDIGQSRRPARRTAADHTYDTAAEHPEVVSIVLCRRNSSGGAEEAELQIPAHQVNGMIEKILEEVTSRFPPESLVTIRAGAGDAVSMATADKLNDLLSERHTDNHSVMTAESGSSLLDIQRELMLYGGFTKGDHATTYRQPRNPSDGAYGASQHLSKPPRWSAGSRRQKPSAQSPTSPPPGGGGRPRDNPPKPAHRRSAHMASSSRRREKYQSRPQSPNSHRGRWQGTSDCNSSTVSNATLTDSADSQSVSSASGQQGIPQQARRPVTRRSCESLVRPALTTLPPRRRGERVVGRSKTGSSGHGQHRRYYSSSEKSLSCSSRSSRDSRSHSSQHSVLSYVSGDEDGRPGSRRLPTRHGRSDKNYREKKGAHEVREVIVEVPVVEVEWIEKKVEVPRVEIVEKIVEVQQIEEVVRYVPVKEIQKVEKVVTKEVVKPEIKEVIREVQVPGEIIEHTKEVVVEKPVIVDRFHDKHIPVSVVTTLQPIVTTPKDQVYSHPAKVYEPQLLPVDVYVPFPVEVPVDGPYRLDAQYYAKKSGELPDQFYNSLVLTMNRHLLNKDLLEEMMTLQEATQRVNPDVNVSDITVKHDNCDGRLNKLLPHLITSNNGERIPAQGDTTKFQMDAAVIPELLNPEDEKAVTKAMPMYPLLGYGRNLSRISTTDSRMNSGLLDNLRPQTSSNLSNYGTPQSRFSSRPVTRILPQTSTLV